MDPKLDAIAPASAGSVGAPGFKVQAGALLRKNLAVQRRNWKTNLWIMSAPAAFCILLFLLQRAANSSINNNADSKCGCKCLVCCSNVDKGGFVCRNNTSPLGCSPGTFDDCKQMDTTQCGIQYSNDKQAVWCPITEPSTWPPFMPIAAQKYRPGLNQVMPITGADAAAVRDLGSYMFPKPLSNVSLLSPSLRLFSQKLAQGVFYGQPFSVAGFTLGTPADNVNTLYLESAFLNNAGGIYNVVPDCANDTSTALLNGALASSSGNPASILKFAPQFNCVTATTTFFATPSAIEERLFCGYQQARCNATTTAATFDSYSYAWDYQDTRPAKFQLNMWYNATRRRVDASGSPAPGIRISKGINLAVNAFLSWTLGPQYTAALLAVSEMPTGPSRLQLDFSSLLGPIFYSWVGQMLMPLMLVALVYEKEKRLRIMMKMHGLGDGAYWAIMYGWFQWLYICYIATLLLIGSAVNLSFFRLNNYLVQIVFWLLWGSCLIAFTFLVSTFFTKARTAIVVSFLYVFGSGLLGSLLLETYFQQNASWIVAVELIPSFALYRGLWEFAQYSFRANYQHKQGITWARLGDTNNHLWVVMVIMFVEWSIFLPLAWYLEQVLPTGTGVRRHPLFFLHRHKKANSADAATYDAATKLDLEHEDVRDERHRINALDDLSDHSLVIRDLRKVYPAPGALLPCGLGGAAELDKVAVKGLTMGVQRGECFGLLGPNGAGKSTAIHMLVGLSEPTAGTALVEGTDIASDMSALYGIMGVCPQHDLLWDELTARDHLRFYGRLKHLKNPELEAAVDTSLRKVNLFFGKTGDKPVMTFSGGMKRRLSVAISLIGSPRVVYLDEPSTGLDPASRRNLWDVVRQAKAGRGIILTTHSMEEAQVLCDRLGIFVDGQLVCIGSPRELTARYGGYLVFTITTAVADAPAALAFVQSTWPSARGTYALAGTQKFELPIDKVSVGGVFAAMEAAQAQFPVLDWGVANATLEEVFIKFARSIGAEGGQ